MAKRCMTSLDDDALKAVTALRAEENRTESQMIAILVKEAIAVRSARKQRAEA